MILFTIIPLFLIVYFAFTDADGSFTVSNVEQAVKYIPALVKSISLAAIATVLCLLLAYPFAFAMSRLSFERQKMMSMLIMLPMWMNFLLRTYAWQAILEDNGVINTLLTSIGLSSVKLINTSGAVVLGMVYNYIPFMILPLYSVMTKIDKSVLEAASDLGAGFFATLYRVILPLSMPGIVSGTTMVFVPAVSTFVISGMLGGVNNYLIGDLIETQFLGNSYDLNCGSATSLLLMVVVLITMAIFNHFSDEDAEE
ncbi:MAG: ABC transporter permease, partial [Clostridia bacterium]|nr:ABC transporter permease [Clostridia bacterium]